jgi:hypothetical protein
MNVEIGTEAAQFPVKECSVGAGVEIESHESKTNRRVEYHLLSPVFYLSGYVGGYTGSALFNLTRSKELLLRWAEYAAFTPLMRTHEGNQPAANHQESGASRITKTIIFLTIIINLVSVNHADVGVCGLFVIVKS